MREKLKNISTQNFSKREKYLLLLVIVLIIALVTVIFTNGSLLSLLQNNDNGLDNNQSTTIFTSFYSGKSNVSLPIEFDMEGLLEVHFIDVGQGDAIFLRFPDGIDMLIDAGSGAIASNASKNKFADFFLSMNISKLDYLLITHPDSDHVNMANILLNNYAVHNIYYNDVYENSSNTYKSFIDLTQVEEEATLYPIDDDGEYYFFENTTLNYRMDIYAPGYDRFSDVNSMSIICLLQYGDIKVLFTGDAHEDTEAYLMDALEENNDIDILKVGHHGSSSSTSEAFLEFFTPEYAIISVGETNTYNHPSPLVMNTLFNLGIVTYRTNRHGNITLYLDKNGNFAFLPEKNVPIENNSKEIDSKMLIIPQD